MYSYGLVVVELLVNCQMEEAFNFGLKKHQKRFGLSIAHKIAKGWRPQLNPELVSKYPNYCQLITDCWAQDSSTRPKFSAILNYLLRLQRNISIDLDCEIHITNLSSSDSSSTGPGSHNSSASSTMTGCTESNSGSAISTPSGTNRGGGGSFHGKPSMPSLREDTLYAGGQHHPRSSSNSSESGSVSSHSESLSNSQHGSNGGSFRSTNGGAGSFRGNAGPGSFRDDNSPRTSPRGTFKGTDNIVQQLSAKNLMIQEDTEGEKEQNERIQSMKSSDRAMGVVMQQIMHPGEGGG